MTLKDQEDYLVYLRIALEHLDIDPLISEESYLSLLLRYLDLFKHLAHTESALRLALLEKRHMFYRQGDKKLLAMQESLVADLFR